jgi:hypothetical protein
MAAESLGGYSGARYRNEYGYKHREKSCWWLGQERRIDIAKYDAKIQSIPEGKDEKRSRTYRLLFNSHETVQTPAGTYVVTRAKD